MSRLRLLLFWLLVLAVPLQGWAATSKLLCDSARGERGYEAADVHRHDVAHLHHHAGSFSSAQVDGEAAVNAGAADGPAHQCGLCAACCHAVAIGYDYQPVFASPAPQADIPEIAARIPSRGVRLPEKPPRA